MSATCTHPSPAHSQVIEKGARIAGVAPEEDDNTAVRVVRKLRVSSRIRSCVGDLHPPVAIPLPRVPQVPGRLGQYPSEENRAAADATQTIACVERAVLVRCPPSLAREVAPLYGHDAISSRRLALTLNGMQIDREFTHDGASESAGARAWGAETAWTERVAVREKRDSPTLEGEHARASRRAVARGKRSVSRLLKGFAAMARQDASTRVQHGGYWLCIE